MQTVISRSLGTGCLAPARDGRGLCQAKVVEFLATDLSDYVTSAVIPIVAGCFEADQPGSQERDPLVLCLTTGAERAIMGWSQ
jgi:hypothetical protein